MNQKNIIHQINFKNMTKKKLTLREKNQKFNFELNNIAPRGGNFYKHHPSSTKEWYNSIYTYNKNDMRNVYCNYIQITKLLKSFITSIPKYLNWKVPGIKRMHMTRQVYMSKPELKHNSEKVIITLYIFTNYRFNLTLFLKYLNKENFRSWIYKKKKLLKMKNLIENPLTLKYLNNLTLKNKIFNELPKYRNLIKILKLENKIYKIKKFFEDGISKYFNKAVIIKFIRLKYLYLNNNMVSEFINIKLSKRISLFKARRKIWKMRFPYFNRWIIVDPNKNSYKTDLLFNNISKLPLKVLKTKNTKSNWNKIFTRNYYKEVISLLKYKYPMGIRLASAGRLTPRYRADRAIYSMYYKGSLRNIDSSHRGWSVPFLRGNHRPNLQYCMTASKVKTGAFGVKSWLSFYSFSTTSYCSGNNINAPQGRANSNNILMSTTWTFGIILFNPENLWIGLDIIYLCLGASLILYLLYIFLQSSCNKSKDRVGLSQDRDKPTRNPITHRPLFPRSIENTSPNNHGPEKECSSCGIWVQVGKVCPGCGAAIQ